MIAASQKQQDELNCDANFFPTQKRKKEGAGHWLVAYREAEEQRYNNLQRRHKRSHKRCDDMRAVNLHHGNRLDSHFLLQSHCVDQPSELSSVNISEQQLNAVKPEDLKGFVNVVYIDASINALSIGAFSSFTSLRELNLSFNGLCNMTFDAAEFPHLKVLDLSYNSLSSDAIISIGRLSCLKVLHLTGNQLDEFPPDLGLSSHDPTEQSAAGENSQFMSLEDLMLDDNKLSSGVFNCLKGLKRLKHLDLKGNSISEIPYLQPTNTLKALTEERDKEEGLAHSEPSPCTDEHFKTTLLESFGGSILPLPALEFLNLGDNKITEEDGLMAAALFPSLQEINICSNPLTTKRSGDPPLLTYYLQERLGIRIRRKKEPQAVKLSMKVSTNPKWKVEEKIPEVSKKSLWRAVPYPVKLQVEKDEMNVKKAPEPLHENTEHFFVTQLTDVESDFQNYDTETAQTKDRNKMVRAPAESLCYETLMDAKPNHDAAEPIGIQTAVRMLEYTLKNLSVYRDSKPKLDSIQTPYREREKRIKKLPPLKQIKQPTEKVNEMIREIRESKSRRQVPLGSTIRSKSVTKQDYKEAQSLMSDMRTKYKTLHQKTMEQMGSTESETDTNRNRAEHQTVNSLSHSGAELNCDFSPFLE